MLPLPIRDDNPTYRAPVVTIALIVINVAVWIFEFTNGVDLVTGSFGAIPTCIVHGPGDVCSGVVEVGRHLVRVHQEIPAIWTILTAMFLHGGWFHILGNMWFLWIFGDNIEDAMGPIRYLVFYLVCGVAAAAAQILTTQGSPFPMVGASGAIAGVLGGYLLLYPRARIKCLWILIIIIMPITLPAWLILGVWFLSQFFLPGAGVAWMAHVGGFLAGLGLVRLFVKARLMRPRRLEPGIHDLP